jgi:hypothetical protein
MDDYSAFCSFVYLDWVQRPCLHRYQDLYAEVSFRNMATRLLYMEGYPLMLRFSLAVPLLASLLVYAVHPVTAQSESEPTDPELTSEEILQACAQGQAEQLPSPFTDVVPSDWAYKAVLTLYYCGAYRGAIPPQQYQQHRKKNTNSSGLY